MQENGRQRAAKIDRSYHAAFDRFLYRKRWMSLLGLVVGVACSVWMFSSNGAIHQTTGELSQPHFAWNKTGCENCHLPNVPIRKDAFGGEDIRNISRNNQKCNGTCHAVTDHFASETKKEVQETESCSTCHREHLGFDHSLVEVPDINCSRCHANMTAISKADGGKKAQQVNNFSEPNGHPPFAGLKLDPGTILFSHIQHLRPGQPKMALGRDAKRLNMLPERFQPFYKNKVNNDLNQLVQLTCSSCHSRDVELKGYESLELPESNPIAAVQSSTHMLFKPIEFEKHCVACHELDGVPHGLKRTQTKQVIESLLPVKQLEQFRTQPATEEQIEARETRLRAVLEYNSINMCKKCHQLEPDSDSRSIVKPSNLKTKWLGDASFTHGAHLMVNCKECHAEAYRSSNELFDSTTNERSREEARQVMIAGIEKCRECHIQGAEKRSKSFGKNKHVASADCIDCHRYHVDPPKTPTSKAASSLSEVQRYLANETSP